MSQPKSSGSSASFCYFDVHCHLNMAAYDADRDAVIRRAAEAGVAMIVVGVDIESSRKAVELAEKYQNIWACVGLHPADNVFELSGIFDRDLYMKLASHPKTLAIGECGLDYFHGGDRSRQVEIFEEHIRLAHDVGKPLMLHIRNGKNEKGKDGKVESEGRDAYADVLDILKKSRAAGRRIVANVHFFAGSVECAREFIDFGAYLSFTGVITFAPEYHDIIRAVPVDRIMSETDAPFVTPAPYRGTRNEPAYVSLVVKAITDIRGDGSVPEALVTNAKRFFNI